MEKHHFEVGNGARDLQSDGQEVIFAALGGSWAPCERLGDPETYIFDHSGSFGRAFGLIWEALARHFRQFGESRASLLESRRAFLDQFFAKS